MVTVLVAAVAMSSFAPAFPSNASPSATEITTRAATSDVACTADRSAADVRPAGALLGSPKAADRRRVEAAAESSGVSGDTFAQAATRDDSLVVDGCGQALFVDPVHPQMPTDAETELSAVQRHRTAEGPIAPSGIEPPEEGDRAPAPRFPLADTFLLESRPGSDKTLYLDFTGASLAGSYWNDYFQKPSLAMPGYDFDGRPETFTDAERTEIQYAWEGVRDDFAAFDVNVTTKRPAAGALSKDFADDAVFGFTALITSSEPLQTQCMCGGLGLLNVANFDADAFAYYSPPALVFQAGTRSQGRNVGEATSHEFGHNFGLFHDGLDSEYYSGANAWAPIMGVGYAKPVTQWSAGEYTGATLREDDTARINSTLPYLPDDYPSSPSDATRLTFDISAASILGTIERRGDVDAFTFTATSNFDLVVAPSGVRTNVDLQATLVDQSTGATVAVINNPTNLIDSYQASGLDASASLTLPAGGSRDYLLLVTGAGSGDPLVPGQYSDYGSLGRYAVKVRPGPGAPPVAPEPAPMRLSASRDLVAETASFYFEYLFEIAGGEGPYVFSGAGMPPGLSLSEDGLVYGYAQRAGTWTTRIFATDVRNKSAAITIATTVVESDPGNPTENLAIDAIGFGSELTVGTPYSRTVVTRTGGRAPFTWSAGNLPAGLAINAGSGVVFGTPTVAGSGTADFAVSDAGARSLRTAQLGWTVAPAGNPVVFPDQSLATTEVGVPTRRSLQASGGDGTFDFAATQVPPGMTLTRDGVLNGVPRTAGSYRMNVTVGSGTGSSRRTVVAGVQIEVVPLLQFTTAAALPAGTRGKTYARSIRVSDGYGAISWRKVSGTVPKGLRLVAPTGKPSTTPTILQGIPKKVGRFSFTVVALDELGAKTVRTFTIKVS